MPDMFHGFLSHLFEGIRPDILTMLAKVSFGLLATGSLFLFVSCFGVTCFNGRWYNHHWIQEWSWAYGLENKKAADSAISSCVFGVFCGVSAVCGYVLLILEFRRVFMILAFCCSAFFGLITLIPIYVLVCNCSVFSEYTGEYHKDQSFWVPHISRDYVNKSDDFSLWFFGFWDKQMEYAGDLNIDSVNTILGSIGGGGFAHPGSEYWSSSMSRFIPVAAWGSVSTHYRSHSYDCVVDFRDGKTVYGYSVKDTRSVCSTLKASVVGECFSYWNEARLTGFMQEECNAEFDIYEGDSESSTSPEAYNHYHNKVASTFSTNMVEEGLATLYLCNVIFLGLINSGLGMVIIGVVLSLILGGDDVGVNDSKLIPE